MDTPPVPAEKFLELAILHVNAGQPDRARVICDHALTAHPTHPAVLQLLAQLEFDAGQLEDASRHIAASLMARPDQIGRAHV